MGPATRSGRRTFRYGLVSNLRSWPLRPPIPTIRSWAVIRDAGQPTGTGRHPGVQPGQPDPAGSLVRLIGRIGGETVGTAAMLGLRGVAGIFVVTVPEPSAGAA